MARLRVKDGKLLDDGDLNLQHVSTRSASTGKNMLTPELRERVDRDSTSDATSNVSDLKPKDSNDKESG